MSRRTHAESVWADDANNEYLKKAVANGDTAADIAAVIGNGVTRNGVIGRIHRLGLSVAKPKPQGRKPRKRNRAKKQVFGVVEAIEPIELPAPSIEDATIPRMQLKSLVELENSECRWAVNDISPFLFCAASVAFDGCPYCPGHYRRAINPNAYRNALRPVR